MQVGFTGLKGSGKDTAALYLTQHHGFQQFALADALYREVAIAFGVNEADLRSREWKNTTQDALRLSRCADINFIRTVITAEAPRASFNIGPFCTEIQSCPRTSTFIVQRWATEYRRAQLGKNYWVDRLVGKLLDLPRSARVVISDVREDHEVVLFDRRSRMRGPVQSGIAEIIMPGTKHTGHSSDNGLSRHLIDTVITNQPGDLSVLHQQLEDFIKEKLKWMPSQ